MSANLLPPNRPILNGRVVQVAHLSPDTRAQMFALMQQYYLNVTWASFSGDLNDKQWVMLVADQSSGQVRGFSTLARFRICVDDQPATMLFSGDTILDPTCRGNKTLHRLAGRHMLQVAAAVAVEPVYWFLICSGYKTYRILPVFFDEFYPCYQHPTPLSARRLLDTAAFERFGARYDARQGIIRLEHATPLRAGVADIDARRLRDPHVAFFVAANPGHTAGDELVCLTRLAADNLTPAGRRIAEG